MRFPSNGGTPKIIQFFTPFSHWNLWTFGIHHLKIPTGRLQHLQLLQAVSASLMWTARWRGSRMWWLLNAPGLDMTGHGVENFGCDFATCNLGYSTNDWRVFSVSKDATSAISFEGFCRLGSHFSWPETTKEASLLIGTSSIWSYDHYTKRPAVLPALQFFRVCWRGWSEEDVLTYLASIEWLNKHQIKYKQYKHHVHLVSWAFHRARTTNSQELLFPAKVRRTKWFPVSRRPFALMQLLFAELLS